MGLAALMFVAVRTMHTVTPRTDHVLVPLGGLGLNVISHVDRENMEKTVNMTASVEMVQNVTQHQENVTVQQGGEGSTVTLPAHWEVGVQNANSSAPAEMGGPATMRQVGGFMMSNGPTAI